MIMLNGCRAAAHRLIVLGLVALIAELAAVEVNELLALPATERTARFQALFTASQPEVWPQGTSVSEAMQYLRAGGQNVLLPLGLSGGDLSAAEPDWLWWQAVLALCASQGLEPAAPRSPAIEPVSEWSERIGFRIMGLADLAPAPQGQPAAGGALLLGPSSGPQLPSIVVGPVLLRLHRLVDERLIRLGGTRRSIELVIEPRLEPRLPLDLIRSVQLVLGAIDEQGRVCHPYDPQHESLAELIIPPWSDPPNLPTLHSLRLELAAGVRQIQLSGRIELHGQGQMQHELRLAPGQTSKLVLAEQRLVISLQRGPNSGQLELLSSPSGLTPPDMVLVGPDGQVLSAQGLQTMITPTQRRMVRKYPDLAPGEHRLQLNLAVELGRIQLPVQWEIILP